MTPRRSGTEGRVGVDPIDGTVRDGGSLGTGGLVGTAMPPGVGRVFGPRRYVQVGDTIEVQFERLGRPQPQPQPQAAFAA